MHDSRRIEHQRRKDDQSLACCLMCSGLYPKLDSYIRVDSTNRPAHSTSSTIVKVFAAQAQALVVAFAEFLGVFIQRNTLYAASVRNILRPKWGTATKKGRGTHAPSLFLCVWSGKRDSNPQPSAWEADALPLRHSRVELSDYSSATTGCQSFCSSGTSDLSLSNAIRRLTRPNARL